MSTQNQKTLEAYEKVAKNYLKGAQVFNENEAEWTRKFILDSLRNVTKGSRILEVGSANGNNAAYLRELDYAVTASDVADDFLAAIKSRGFEPLKFNLLTDVFPEKYSAIFCWKVFVHFTKRDILKALKRSHVALEDDGVFMFCVIDKTCKTIESEWADFPGIFHVGADRYFHYYSREEINDIVERTEFAVLDCRSYTAENGVKWLAYTLRKREKERKN